MTKGMDVERRPRFSISNIDVRAYARDGCDNHRVRHDYQLTYHYALYIMRRTLALAAVLLLMLCVAHTKYAAEVVRMDRVGGYGLARVV